MTKENMLIDIQYMANELLNINESFTEEELSDIQFIINTLTILKENNKNE